MARFRFATWNIEWFNALFDAEDRLIADEGASARFGITRRAQAEAIALVLARLDADALLIVEAPDHSRRRSTVRALEGFAAQADLRSRAAIIGYPNETQQEIALLYDPDRLSLFHDPRGVVAARTLGEGPAPRFDRSVRLDVQGNGAPEPISFSKPPLELALTIGARKLRLVGVHIKSKAPTGARSADEAVALQISNRRKQLAQCLWLRARMVEDLKAGEDVIVLGDFNDGPGLDEWESLFGQSGVEIVMGEAGALQLYDPHARMALAQRGGAQPATARFLVPDLASGNRYWLSALLDYIMISERLRSCAPAWRIWHPFDDPDCYVDAALREALLTASDHFPVTLDLDL